MSLWLALSLNRDTWRGTRGCSEKQHESNLALSRGGGSRVWLLGRLDWTCAVDGGEAPEIDDLGWWYQCGGAGCDFEPRAFDGAAFDETKH